LALDKSTFVFETLSSAHDREGFDCGKAPLNDFLKRVARQNADRNIGVTTVVVPETGSSKILGYYTLVVRTVSREIIPADMPGGHRLPPGEIGVVLLGRLATDKETQGQGIGKLLLLRVLSKVELASREMGIYGLVLDALDDEAKNWYMGLKFGFRELADNPHHLCLPISTIRELLSI
jgi:GNAT superfamily N-acetyltransferase